eukprot:TRINITY_DN19155_c0_g1_i1.p1 TRINITY_DN19155_c0_g1~~TRINITY_DN19155_c0_g1_i1.p1  ORF type:complete len:357 (+),score=84.26 TRINITY_DN19155_c0_g1_i1:64-1071(+)
MLSSLIVVSSLSAATTLRDAGERTGRFIGTAVNYYHEQQDVQYPTVVEREYNLYTAENSCKFSETEPQQGVFTFDRCDYIYNTSKANNATFRGHNLCWGVHNPGWLVNGTFTSSQKTDILKNHITTVAARYVSKAYSWDVVNEAVSDHPNPSNSSDIFKQNVWYPDIPNYVDLAFLTASKSAGGSKLFYNDYNILDINTKSTAVYNMIKGMKERGVPVDGIGFQCHITEQMNINTAAANFQRFASLGLEIHVTELDISCDQSCTLDQQAAKYEQVLKLCLDQPSCKSFETWGFTDKYLWNTKIQRPLPFNATYGKKPAYYTLLKTLNAYNATMAL